MSLRERQRRATRDALFDAARALLEEGGASALTFRALADRAGVSVGTVANHVGSKAHLVVALLVAEILTAMAQRVPSTSADPVTRRVDAFRPFFEQYAARPALARSTIVEVAFAPDDAFAPYLALTLGFVGELAAELEAEGSLLPNVPPMVAARVLFDAYLGEVVFYLRAPAPDVDAGLAALRARFEALAPVLFAP